MDYEAEIQDNGSELWQKLAILRSTSSSNPLDPADVKRCIIQTERRRAEKSNVLPENRLFSIGNQNVPNLLGERIGQQDAKEFFMCLDENQSVWPDLFEFLKIGTISETECTSCGNVSRQENCYNISCFIRLDCPGEDTTLKSYIEEKMNGFELRENWRDESGCNSVTTGKNKTKITDMSGTNYVVVIVKRLIEIDNQLLIMDTKIKTEMHELIKIEDSQGNIGQFQLLSIIHHVGNVVGIDTTRGHYYADVKNVDDGIWYRTSDSNEPIDLTNKGLTDNGYIFLFKKIASEIDQYAMTTVHDSDRSTNLLRKLVSSQMNKL